MTAAPLPCPGCSEPSFSEVFRLPDYRVARCSACGLLHNPDFPPNGPGSGPFEEDYYLEVQREAFAPQAADYRQDPSLPAFNRGLDRLERLAGGPGRLLDVGSALGTFLRLARDRGWQIEGVEVSAYGARHTSRAHGIEVFNGDLEQAPFAPGSFDCLTFWDVIEHLEHPLGNLRRARRLLKPAGYLLITTDNFDCLIAGLAKRLYEISSGRLTYPVRRVFIPYNRIYFTARSLRELLSPLSFKEVYFAKMEYPLSKIKAGPWERAALKCLYAIASLSKRQAQLTMILQKQ